MAKKDDVAVRITNAVRRALRENKSTTPPKVGRYTGESRRRKTTDQYVNELYKLTATRARLDEMKHKATVKIFDDFIVDAEAGLAAQMKWEKAQQKDADQFVKDVDVNKIRDAGFTREALRTVLEEE